MGGGFVENHRRHWLAESGDKTTSRQGRRNIGCADRQSASNGKRVRIHGGGGRKHGEVCDTRDRQPATPATASGLTDDSRSFLQTLFFFFVFIGNAVYVNSPQRYFPLRTVQAV